MGFHGLRRRKLTAKPPPAVREVVRVPVDEEGREILAP